MIDSAQHSIIYSKFCCTKWSRRSQLKQKKIIQTNEVADFPNYVARHVPFLEDWNWHGLINIWWTCEPSFFFPIISAKHLLYLWLVLSRGKQNLQIWSPAYNLILWIRLIVICLYGLWCNIILSLILNVTVINLWRNEISHWDSWGLRILYGFNQFLRDNATNKFRVSISIDWRWKLRCPYKPFSEQHNHNRLLWPFSNNF